MSEWHNPYRGEGSGGSGLKFSRFLIPEIGNVMKRLLLRTFKCESVMAEFFKERFADRFLASAHFVIQVKRYRVDFRHESVFLIFPYNKIIL